MLDGSRPEIQTSQKVPNIPLERLDLVDRRTGIVHHTVSVGNNVLGGMVLAGIDKDEIQKLFPEAEDLLAANPNDES